MAYPHDPTTGQNLGIIDFVKTEDVDLSSTQNTNVFYLQLTNDRKDEKSNTLKAQLVITSNGYRVLKGSFIEKEERVSFKKHNYYTLRAKIESLNYLKESKYDECYLLDKDIDFNSSSAAASVVKNRATNGPKEWKLLSGQTLDDWELNNAANVVPNLLSSK